MVFGLAGTKYSEVGTCSAAAVRYSAVVAEENKHQPTKVAVQGCPGAAARTLAAWPPGKYWEAGTRRVGAGVWQKQVPAAGLCELHSRAKDLQWSLVRPDQSSRQSSCGLDRTPAADGGCNQKQGHDRTGEDRRGPRLRAADNIKREIWRWWAGRRGRGCSLGVCGLWFVDGWTWTWAGAGLKWLMCTEWLGMTGQKGKRSEVIDRMGEIPPPTTDPK